MTAHPVVGGRTDAREWIISLDLLRAAAALVVFLGHVKTSSFVEFGALPIEHRGALTAAFFGLARLGHEAVMVFFVLSGFLVGGQVLRHVQEKRFDVMAYAIERSTRIYLPLIPACLLTVLLGWLALGHEVRLGPTLANMIGLNEIVVGSLDGNWPLWTLPFEIWFYLLAGAVGYLFSVRRPSPLALMVIACCVCVFSVLPARYLCFWCVGALMVLFMSTPRSRTLAVVGVFIFMVGVVAYELGGESKTFVSVSYLPTAVAEALICVGVSLTLPLLCGTGTNTVLGALRKPAASLSAFSYTLYLVHFPLSRALGQIFPKADELTWHAIGIFAGKVVFILLFAHAFYWAFEARTGAVRRFLKRRLMPRSSA